jgi:hypothetical protein
MGIPLAIEKDYHRRQAATLIRLAQTARDPDMAAVLMRLVAEHVRRAEAQNSDEPESDAAT